MTLRRLLAVTHQASVTGAPMNLLHLLRWLAEHDVEVHTLVLEDGPMVHRFEQVGDVTVLGREVTARLAGWVEEGLHRYGAVGAMQRVADARLVPRLRHLRGFDVVYLNSATSIRVARQLPPAPLVVHHIHELDVALRTMLDHDREALRTVPDVWIAASEPVRSLLTGELALPTDRVLVHEEFIAAQELAARHVTAREVEAVRRSVPEIPTTAAIVVGCGTLDWRKGPDLFIQLASEVRRRTRHPVHFVWLGGEHAGVDWERVRSDRERAGADHVHFLPVVADPVPWFVAADVFALTSREDPLPLVCLEAGVLGTPVVTYRSGGIPSLLHAAGPVAAAGIIDHLDVVAMADRVLALLHDGEQRRLAGDQLRTRVLHAHEVSVEAPRLAQALQELAAAAPPER